MPQQRNILILMTDQQRFDCLGYANKHGLKTPNLDRLSEKGVVFTQAYTTCPICVPARASFLSGMYAHNLGLLDNSRSLPSGCWTAARELRGQNYQTALIGKMHLKPIHQCHGFDTMEMAEHDPTQEGCFVIDEYHKWLNGVGITDRQEISQYPTENFYADEDYAKNLSAQCFPYDEKCHSSNWVADRSLRWLSERDKSRPFFLISSFIRPHTPVNPPRRFVEMYENSVVRIPDIHEMGAWPAEVRELLKGYVNFYNVEITQELIEKFVRYTYASLTHMDEMAGRILESVDLEDTLVIFTSDHGDYLGNKHHMLKSPSILFDDLTRIPLFLSGAGLPPGRVVDTPVSICDIPVTVADIGGGTAPESCDGVSLLSIAERPDRYRDRVVYAANNAQRDLEGHRDNMVMVRKGNYKLIVSKDFEMLFDLQNDPGEKDDLLTSRCYNREVYEELHRHFITEFHGTLPVNRQ